jgi:hypothetical protein
MSHTKLNTSADKQNSKLLLLTFAQNGLQQQLPSHPLLNRRLDAGLTAWFQELTLLPDAVTPPGLKPSFDTYVSPALREENKQAVEKYFSSIQFYALGLAEEVPKGLQDKLETAVLERKAELTRTQQAWELGDTAYSQKVEEWEAEDAEHPRLKKEYTGKIGGLRRRLNAMIQTFNERSRYDEDLEQNDVDTFRLTDYNQYVPTLSFYNNAAGGTLYYDFQNNRFQLHFHCAKNAAKAEAIRLKLYGEEKGRNYDRRGA